MSDFWSRRDERVGKVDGRAAKPRLDEQCPLLSAALQGRWDEQHGCFVGSTYRLGLKHEAGAYLVSLWGGENVETWFCTFHSLDALIEQVEAALSQDRGEWRKPKSQKSH